MKIFFLTRYYDDYLRLFYQGRPEVLRESYRRHRDALFDDHFAWPAEMAEYMRSSEGIDAEMVVYNAEILQKAWAREAKFQKWSPENWRESICMEQIKRFRPDVLWIFPFELFGGFVKSARPHAGKIITWVGAPFFKEADVAGISTLITENPDTLRSIHNRFESVVVTTPGFAYREILRRIGPTEKKYPLTFLGGLSPVHGRRAEILAYLLENGVDLKVFGYIHPAPDRPDFMRHVEMISPAHRGPVYGLDYYRTLAESHATLNIHIDCAGDNAGNMRLFQATGMGACTLTEHAKNIERLFQPGSEVLTYRTKEDLLERVREISSNPARCDEIGRAGQKRTLSYHTLEKMFEEIRPVLDGSLPKEISPVTRILNVGCGSTFSGECTNIDIAPANDHVGKFDIRRGIPYENERFDAVYHSHLLEHLEPSDGESFMKECARVLRPGGIIRIAVPDLEEIARQYLLALEKALAGEPDSNDHYEWMRLELYDQMVREKSGGRMLEYVRSLPRDRRNFVTQRIGSALFDDIDAAASRSSQKVRARRTWTERFSAFLRGDNELLRSARFRNSGEIHRCMYDRYSLGRLLEKCGFERIVRLSARESGIPGWNRYRLDVDERDAVRKPDSLFMEARKAFIS